MKRITLLMTCLAMGLLGGALGQAIFGQEETLLHLPGDIYYSDVSADSPHADDIGFSREAGIARGFSDTLYGPDWLVTREQMATFEMRDFTAGIVFALRISGRLYQDIHGSPHMLPPSSVGIVEEWERDIAFCRWAAELIDYQAATRPADAMGGVNMYSDLAAQLRELADKWEEELPEW